MDNKEMIERVLGRFVKTTEHFPEWDRHGYEESELDFDALAEQAIVVPMLVNILRVGGEDSTALRYWHDTRYYEGMLLDGHLLPPGKALAIIVPVPEEGQNPI